MNEAERCDRISLMHAGRVLAQRHAGGTRAAARRGTRWKSLHRLPRGGGRRSAVEQRACRDRAAAAVEAASAAGGRAAAHVAAFSLAPHARLQRGARRWSSCAIRSACRSRCSARADPDVVFGYGITFDVENLSLRRARSRPDAGEPRLSRELRGLALFRRAAADRRPAESTGGCAAATSAWRSRSRPASARICVQGADAEVGVWIDGAMPFRAETIRGYVQGHRTQPT